MFLSQLLLLSRLLCESIALYERILLFILILYRYERKQKMGRNDFQRKIYRVYNFNNICYYRDKYFRLGI
nr:MAG TPA: hypothetical protein [Caudoviricetes sp.]